MLLRLPAGYHHRDDEVGRVAGRRQRSAALARLVDGRHVDRLGGDVGAPARLEPDGRQNVEEDARLRLVQLVDLSVPARSVDEQAVYEGTVVRGLRVLLQTHSAPTVGHGADPCMDWIGLCWTGLGRVGLGWIGLVWIFRKLHQNNNNKQ